MISLAYDFGWIAFERGDHCNSNPYTDEEHWQWRRGYYDAEFFYSMKS